jgi:hypothetical protein
MPPCKDPPPDPDSDSESITSEYLESLLEKARRNVVAGNVSAQVRNDTEEDIITLDSEPAVL